MPEPASPPSGPAVDARGVPTPDPTENVIRNLNDAVKRLDDVIEAAVLRQDDLRNDTRSDFRRENKLRARYEEKLRKAESRRIDAIHKADATAQAQVAAIQAAAQASLQRQVSAGRQSNQWVIGTVIAVAVALISLAGLVVVVVIKG